MPIQNKQQPPYYTPGSTQIKTYTAILTQSGTDAPTAQILENTLGGTPIWTYTEVGGYTATLANAFPADKIWFSGILPARDGIIAMQAGDGNFIFLTTSYSVDGTASNNYLNPGYITIKIYTNV